MWLPAVVGRDDEDAEDDETASTVLATRAIKSTSLLSPTSNDYTRSNGQLLDPPLFHAIVDEQIMVAGGWFLFSIAKAIAVPNRL